MLLPRRSLHAYQAPRDSTLSLATRPKSIKMRTCRRTSTSADACCLCAFFAMAGTVNVEAAELCHCNHDGQSDTLTINLVLGVQLNLPIIGATNETRAFPRVGREKAHSSTRTRWIFGHCGVSNMGRAIVEEIATLASLALFVGMVAIWAQVIATL